MRMPKARKTGDIARTPLKRKRARYLESCRNTLSGSKGGMRQYASELKRLSTASRQEVCSLAGSAHKSVVRKYEIMTMKAATGTSWRGMAVQ